MTKLSRRPIEEEHLNQFFNNFWNVLTLFTDKQEVKTFLGELLTHTEIKMFAKRLQIAKMLLEGYDYLTIGDFVKVTDQTVAKMNNLLHAESAGTRKAVEQLHQLEEEQERKLKALDPLSYENLKRRYSPYYWPEEIAKLLTGKIRRVLRRRSTG